MPDYHEIIEQVVWVTIRRVGPPEQHREDVASTIRLSLYETLNKCKSSRRLPAVRHLYNTACREATRYLAKESKHGRGGNGPEQQTDDNGEAVDAKDYVDAKWHLLDDREQQAMRLRYWDDQSLSEIGAALGCSKAMAGKVVSKALAKMAME